MTGLKKFDLHALRARLKAARVAAGLTQTEAATRTGGAVGQDYVSKLEAGTIAEPKFNDVAQLAAVCGLELPELALASGLPIARSGRKRASLVDAEDARIRYIVDRLQRSPDQEWRASFTDRMYKLVLLHEGEEDLTM